MYAIIRTGGHQEKVTAGEQITVDYLNQRSVGDTVTFPALMISADCAKPALIAITRDDAVRHIGLQRNAVVAFLVEPDFPGRDAVHSVSALAYRATSESPRCWNLSSD